MADALKNRHDFSIGFKICYLEDSTGNQGLTKFWLILLYFACNKVLQILKICHYGTDCDVSQTGLLTMLIQIICPKALLYLQKIVSQPFSANREPHTAIANLNIQK